MTDLVDIPGVELAREGTWRLSTGEETFTHTDFAAGIDALTTCPALRRPILKLGHTDTRFDGQPAVGWADNLRIDGDVLRGDYRGLPASLAGPDGKVLASAYPNCSIEGFRNKTCRLGHTHPFVITAVALLGETEPGATLTDVRDALGLYGLAAAEDDSSGTPFGAPPGPAVVTADDVQRIAAANTQTPPAAPAAVDIHTKGAGMDPAKLREWLSLPADATDEQVSEARDARLTELMTTPPPPAAPPAPVEPPAPVGEVGDIEQLVAAAVEKALTPVLSTLTETSTELAAIKASKAADEKAQLFAAAVGDGRITPAERRDLEREYDEAPGVITRLLNAKAKGSAVPVHASGYTGGDDGSTPDDADFDAKLAVIAAGGRV